MDFGILSDAWGLDYLSTIYPMYRFFMFCIYIIPDLTSYIVIWKQENSSNK